MSSASLHNSTQDGRLRAPRVTVRRRPKRKDSQLRGKDGRSSADGEAVPRGKYRIPDQDASVTESLTKYLQDTKLEQNFKELMGKLLRLPYLPYNPYPGFIKRLRSESERFKRNRNPSDWKILLNFDIEPPRAFFHGLHVRDGVYGLRSVLQMVSPRHLLRHQWLAQSLTPNPDEIYSPEHYTCQVSVALVGRSIFEGIFYQKVYEVGMRLEYMVYGQKTEEAHEIFGKNVLNHLTRLYHSDVHFLAEIRLPDSDKTFVWRPGSVIITEKEEDWQLKIEKLLKVKEYVEVKCVCHLQPNPLEHKSTLLQFSLNFIQLSDDPKNKSDTIVFYSRPMTSLYDGVFLIQSHAEQYTATLSPTDTGNDSSEGTSSLLNIDEDDVRKHGVYSESIITPNRVYLEERLAALDVGADFGEMLHCVILLTLMDRDKHGDQMILEIYKVCTSEIMVMNCVTEHCTALPSFIKALRSREEEWIIIRSAMEEFISDVGNTMVDLEYIRDEVAFTTTCQRLVAKVRSLLPRDGQLSSASFDNDMKATTLNGLVWFCVPLMMQISETVIEISPNIKDMVIAAKEKYTALRYEPPEFIRERPETTSSTLSIDVQHGIEVSQMQGFNHDKLVIPAANIVEQKAEFPKLIEKEGLLIQYIVDTHLDQLWQEQLTDLIESDYYVPNPYPQFLARLRKYAIKMDLFFEKDEEILESIFATELHLEDKRNYIYTVQGVDAYGKIQRRKSTVHCASNSRPWVFDGCWSALAVFDPVTIQPIIQLVQQHFQQSGYQTRQGPYQVVICLALTNSGIWYGKMDPYLNEVILHEHIYIRGPAGAFGDAIRLFSELVYKHVKEMVIKNVLPVEGVYFDDGNRFSWEDIVNKEEAFLDNCSFFLNKKKSIYLKVMCILEGHNEWRYVTVYKYFLLHYQHNLDSRPTLFYDEKPLAFYQSIFLSRANAAYHYRHCGPDGDPMVAPLILKADGSLHAELEKAREDTDWLEVRRLLLMKNLINKERNHVAGTWRMLHSTSAMIEYAVSMVNTLGNLATVMTESLVLEAKLEEKEKQEEEKKEEERVNAMTDKERKKYEKEQEKKRKKEEERKRKEEEKKKKEEEKRRKEEEKKLSAEERKERQKKRKEEEKKKEEERKKKEEEERKKKEEEEKKKKEEEERKKKEEEEKKKKAEEKKKREEERRKRAEEKKKQKEEKKKGKKKQDENEEEDEDASAEEEEEEEEEDTKQSKPLMLVGDDDSLWHIPPTPPATPPPPDVITDIPNFKCPVNETVFGQMTMVTHEFVLDICSSSIALVSKDLYTYIQNKLQTVVETSMSTNNLYLVYKQQTRTTLEHIANMLEQVQDVLAADVKNAINDDVTGPEERPKAPKAAPPQPRPDSKHSILSKITERTEDGLDIPDEKGMSKVIDVDYMEP